MSQPIVPSFRTIKRQQCKLSCSIEGLAGSGKSGLALSMLRAFSPWEKLYAVDTENKSLDLFADTMLHTGEMVGALNVVALNPEDDFKPSHYAALRQAAIEKGAEGILFDSLSHLWQYKGGVLDMVNKIQAENRSYNKYSAWGDPVIVDEKNQIFSLVRHTNLHTVCTIRSKEKLELVQNDEGKTVVQSLGEQQIMMPDFKFEPDLVLAMEQPGEYDEESHVSIAPVARVLKTRYRIFKRYESYSFTPQLLQQMVEYLSKGTNPAELLEQQRQDYIVGVKEYLDANPNAKTIWNVLKKDMGLVDVKLKDMTLKDLKLLYSQVAAQ